MIDQLRAAAVTMKPLLDGIADGLVVVDLHWAPLVYNAAAERMLGPANAPPPGAPAGGYFARFLPDGVTPLPWDERPLARALRGEDVDGQEIIIGPPGGGRLLVSVTARALRDGEGAIVGAVGAFKEVTVARRAEAAVRESERLYRALAAHLPSTVVLLFDRGMKFILAGGGGLATAGLSPEIIEGHPVSEHATPALLPDYRAVFEGRKTDSSIVRGDGRRYRIQLVPVRDEADEIFAGMMVAEDVTGSRATEAALRRSLQEKEILLKEIHHRVKNNLQVVSSLLRLQASHVTEPQARAAFADTEHRVRSIALLHEKLYRADDLASVDMDEYVRGLTAELLRSYGAAAGGVRVVTDVRGVSLGVDAAVPCGLIVNELVTNALKHAFGGGGGGGRVEVRMRRAGDLVELVVSDDGAGLSPGIDLAGASTLGLHLVRTLGRQLKATVKLERDGGTRCTITFRAAATDREA